MVLTRVTSILLLPAFTMVLILLSLLVVTTQFSFAQDPNGQAYSIPSGYNITAQKPHENGKVCNQRVPIIGLTSSSSERGNPPEYTLDRNINTRWSSQGTGAYIRADLGSVKTICGAGIAWFKGDSRQYTFAISTSKDGVNYQYVFKGASKQAIHFTQRIIDFTTQILDI